MTPDDIWTIRRETEQGLRALTARRNDLSLPAVCGDVGAQAEINEIDKMRIKLAARVETCHAAMSALQRELRQKRLDKTVAHILTT